MESWKLAVVGAAVLYGLHNIFVKLAAGRVSDQLGGLILEGTATLFLFAYLIYWWAIGDKSIAPTRAGIGFSLLAGLSVGVGTILYFAIFRMGGNLSVAGPMILVGGVVTMAVAGIIFFGEGMSWMKLLGILSGVMSLYLLSAAKH